jgi:hypothetical protein
MTTNEVGAELAKLSREDLNEIIHALLMKPTPRRRAIVSKLRGIRVAPARVRGITLAQIRELLKERLAIVRLLGNPDTWPASRTR